jgi:ADP-heptose:LPS heptosyltransferase
MGSTDMSGKRYLLVQCCHLPHFFFVGKKLREQHPDAHFDALVTDHPQVRLYIGLFPLFENIFLGQEAQRLNQYDGIIFPLLNRGYRHIKKLALGRGPLIRADFSVSLKPLGRLRLLASALYVSDRPTAEFAAYLERFPHRVSPERVLVIESCHPSLVAKAKGELTQVMQAGAEVTHVRKAPLRELLSRFKGRELDTACVFFSGERGFFGLKLLPFLLRIRRIVVINENRNFFEASATSLIHFLYKRIRYGTKLPSPLAPRIILFQTETVSYVRHAAQRLKLRRLFPHSELIVVCRPADRAEAKAIPEVNRVLCYPKRGVWSYYRFWRQLDRLQPDLACGILSGRSVHRWEKLLFFCLPAPQHLAFNARLDCYQVSITRLFWMFRSELLVFDEQLMALAAMENYILLLQTADDRKMLKAIGVLRDPRIANPAPIAVFCRDNKRTVFQGVPGVKAVYTYQAGKRWEKLRALVRLRRLRVDVLAAVLTGEPFDRLHKLLFLTLPARHRVVFNPDFNCFYLNRLNPLSVVPFFRVAHKPKRCILLIQTADDSATLRALRKTRDPRVTKPAPFLVFCRRDKKDLFAGLPDVDDVITYEPNRRLKSLGTLLRLLKLDIEVVTGLFTGESIFHLQKLLFFILPARHRLVFNHNLDCYYLNRSTFWSLFRSEERLGQLSPSFLLARFLGKALLFLPRFFFLVIWVTGQKLKRAYILASEVR